jgi:uncharacterized membrane protein HdeD (DUF308 family)
MIEERVDALIRNWWAVVLRGVVALLFGVLTIVNPGLTVAVLVVMFGAYAVVNGLFTIIQAVASRHGERHWAALVVSGVLSVALGLLTFFMPGLTAMVLLYLIATWAIIVGITEIMTAVRLRKVVTGEWLLIVAGVLSLIFGVFLIVFPGAGAIAVALWIGTYAIMLGVLLIALGFRLRRWGRAHGYGGRASVS